MLLAPFLNILLQHSLRFATFVLLFSQASVANGANVVVSSVHVLINTVSKCTKLYVRGKETIYCNVLVFIILFNNYCFEIGLVKLYLEQSRAKAGKMASATNSVRNATILIVSDNYIYLNVVDTIP